jgi:hypothetical protein
MASGIKSLYLKLLMSSFHPNTLLSMSMSCRLGGDVRLFAKVIKKVAEKTGVSESNILQGKFPVKRSLIHDDITILTINLTNQT